MLDTLIQNAAIADGSGAAIFRGDIAVQGGRIQEIRRHSGVPGINPDALRVINAEGLTAVPGFIDIHRHGDLSPFGAGEEAEELRQGISFFMNGNCGFSPVPSTPRFFEALQSYARPIMGNIPSRFQGAGFSALRRELEQISLYSSVGYLSGGGALRIAVKGFEGSPLRVSEMDTLTGLLEDELDAGTFGLSLGLMYVPEYYYSMEELAIICRIPAKRNRPVTVHLWREGAGLLDSVERIITLARKCGGAVHISHLKAAGKANWKRLIPQALERIAAARQEGLDISFDVYPYEAGSTALYTLLPPDCQQRGLEALLSELKTPAVRRGLAAELAEEHPGWDNLIPGIGWRNVIIAGGQDRRGRSLAGRSVEDAAREQGRGAVECVCDMLLENDGNVPIVIYSMCLEDVEYVLKSPGAIVASDAVYSAGGLPHPRRFGAQARFLHRFAETLGFEQALRALTALPAERFGLTDRGLLREGAVADILLLDRERFRDTAGYENPARYPRGIAEVFIAGKSAFTEREGPQGKYGGLVTPGGAGGCIYEKHQ